jgi:hypothetical protein
MLPVFVGAELARPSWVSPHRDRQLCTILRVKRDESSDWRALLFPLFSVLSVFSVLNLPPYSSQRLLRLCVIFFLSYSLNRNPPHFCASIY